jgi:multidrug efflux pump subunit AcrA (membrane-fusion protein)
MRLITPIQQYSAAAVAILMLGLMAGCATYAPRPLNKSAAPKEGVEQLDHGPDPLPPPARGSIPDIVTAYGTAVPAINGGTTLSVQSDGRVLQIFATPGEAVHAGQRLLDFEISPAARSTYDRCCDFGRQCAAGGGPLAGQ